MILDRFRLDGQVAIVTGAGRGLGLGIAAGLAEAGADIVSVGRTAATPALTERIAATGRRLLPLDTDLAELDDDGAAALLARTLELFGRVDILVNNAGTTRRNPVAEFTTEDWDYVLGVNLRSIFLLSRTVGREFLGQRRGKIVNVASLLSFQGGIMTPAYATAKHGVAGLTKAMANEWAGQGICVNAIAPGYMATDLNERLLNDPERYRQISERIPAGHWGTPEDLAGTAVFLASAASDYVNGQILAVDGGWLAR